MKLFELTVARKNQWDKADPGPLQGNVVLRDADGNEIKVTLTPGAIGRILAQISNEIGATAMRNASLAKQAVIEATDEGLMIDQDGQIVPPKKLTAKA